MHSVDSFIILNIHKQPHNKHTTKIIEKVTQRQYKHNEHIKSINLTLSNNISPISTIKHIISLKISPNLLLYNPKMYKLKENKIKSIVLITGENKKGSIVLIGSCR